MSSEAVEVQKMLEKLEEAVANAPKLEASKQEGNTHLGSDPLLDANLDTIEFEFGKSRKSVRYSTEQNAEILRQVIALNPFATKYGDKHQSWNNVAEKVCQNIDINLSGKQCREQTHRICNRFKMSAKGQDLLNNQYDYVDPTDKLYLEVIKMIGKDKKGTPTKRPPRKPKIPSAIPSFSKEESFSLKRILPKEESNNSNHHQAEEYLHLINQATKEQNKRTKPALEGVDQQLVLISQTEQLRLQELKQQTELMKEMLTFKASIDQRLTALEKKVDQFGQVLDSFAQNKKQDK